MIPQKIHFTWFSSDPYPQKIENCMASWREVMPDYELVHWDMERISSIESPFLKEALAAKKWAFAADFVRLWALYHEGGIYLDTDVECYKPFDDLLHNECFIGKETSLHINGRLTEQYLSSHCMGAVAGHPYIKACLDYYDGRHFVLSFNPELPAVLRLDMTLLPYIQSEIAKTYGYNSYPSANRVQHLSSGLIIYPSHYFDCMNRMADSYCKHLAVGSWRESRIGDERVTLSYKIRWRIRRLVEKLLEANGYVMVKKL